MAGNLLGTLGVTAVAVAVGGIAGTWWWSLLVAGVALCLAAYAAYSYDAATHADGGDQAPAPAAAAVPPPPPGAGGVEPPARAVRAVRT